MAENEPLWAQRMVKAPTSAECEDLHAFCKLFFSLLFDETFKNEALGNRKSEADGNACKHRNAACVDASYYAEECYEKYYGKRDLFDNYRCVAGECGNDSADEGDELISDIYIKGLCVGNDYRSVSSLIISVHIFTCLSIIGI